MVVQCLPNMICESKKPGVWRRVEELLSAPQRRKSVKYLCTDLTANEVQTCVGHSSMTYKSEDTDEGGDAQEDDDYPADQVVVQ